MEKFNLKNKKKVFFIGIGGISMSAIAKILLHNGFFVLGSDIRESDEVNELRRKGAEVFIGHKSSNIIDDLDIVVYSKAIHDDNQEIIEAKNKNIKIMSRSEILGQIMLNYQKRICVAGTHGKTTTTSLISKVLIDKNFSPTINIGGIVKDFGGNLYIGNNQNIFVAEACEYTNSFLDFFPSIAVVTNIEEDHLDFFKDINDIRNSFKKFVELLPKNGLVVINNSIKDIDYLIKNVQAKVITYGDNDDAEYYITNIKYDENNYQLFDIYHNKKIVGTVKIKMLGKHNALNFLASYVVLNSFGISISEIEEIVKDFTGARRRLEFKGVINGVTYIDDYAHHPTEIEASFRALQKIKYKKMYLVFQSHTFSRTKFLYDDFVKILSQFENVILAKIYSAREKDTGIISSNDIKNGILNYKNKKTNICEYFETFDKIVEYLKNILEEKDVVVTMGAGDVYKIFDLMK